jgi:Fic family protein
MNIILTEKLAQLTALKSQLDGYRPLPEALLASLHEWFRVELTYSSNALDGNTLTSSETAMVLEKGITIRGKSVREHLEVINHAHAFDFMIDLMHKKLTEVTLADILDIQRIIIRVVEDQHAGRLRTISIQQIDTNYQFPNPFKVPELMDKFISELHAAKEPPILTAAYAHLLMFNIQPFLYGNGKTARLLMNLILIQAGYPPAIIKPGDREAYIKALQHAQLRGDTDPFLLFIAQAVEESLSIYLEHASKTIA